MARTIALLYAGPGILYMAEQNTIIVQNNINTHGKGDRGPHLTIRFVDNNLQFNFAYYFIVFCSAIIIKPSI